MILVAGDSYSDSCYETQTCHDGNGDPVSWVNLLSRDYAIKCVAQSGSSNYDIVSQVKRSSGYDYLIVNVTSLARLARWRSFRSRESEDLSNFKIAQGLAKRYNTLCWTPYPGYEEVSGIHYLPLAKHNELYNDDVKTICTQHHLDRVGNELLYSWMKERLNETLVDVVQ